MSYMFFREIQRRNGLPEDVVLEGEDGLEDNEELLPLRLWMGTYNLGDDEGEEDAERLTLIAIGADIIVYSGWREGGWLVGWLV